MLSDRHADLRHEVRRKPSRHLLRRPARAGSEPLPYRTDRGGRGSHKGKQKLAEANRVGALGDR